MIFVTVGTQLPFDRLIRAVDEWAGRTGHRDVFAQIGPTEYRPRHVEYARFIDADECRRRIGESRAIVAHAGMGSIITALELGKPIVVMPRRADLGEHRNDHQLSTARRFLAQGRVVVATDEQHLSQKLDDLDRLRVGDRISTTASSRLLQVVGDFVSYGRLPTASTTVPVGIAAHRTDALDTSDVPAPSRLGSIEQAAAGVSSN